MTWKHTIFCLLIIFTFSCTTTQQQLQANCSVDDIIHLQEIAWDAKKNNNNHLARDSFVKMCDCQYAAGCLNASGHYNENDPKWRLLQERACDLGHGNTCFWLGEITEGNTAKEYYEKGCSFLPLEKADGTSCRMAGVHNIENHDKASSYFEKGCLLEDIKSCIEAYRIIKEPIRKQRIKKLSCEIGIPEVCK